MLWDEFFALNDGNQWPDNEIIKHTINIFQKYKNLKENNTIIDLGCGTGCNLKFYLNYSKDIFCIDISKNAIEKIKCAYKQYVKDEIIKLDCEDFNNSEFRFIEKIKSNKSRIYIDCTCLQHINENARLELLKRISREKKDFHSFLITKTLFFESQKSGMYTNFIKKNEIKNLYSKIGEIIRETTLKIVENDLIQEYLILTVKI